MGAPEIKRRRHCRNFASPAHRSSFFRFCPNGGRARPSFHAQRSLSIEPRQNQQWAPCRADHPPPARAERIALGRTICVSREGSIWELGHEVRRLRNISVPCIVRSALRGVAERLFASLVLPSGAMIVTPAYVAGAIRRPDRTARARHVQNGLNGWGTGAESAVTSFSGPAPR